VTAVAQSRGRIWERLIALTLLAGLLGVLLHSDALWDWDQVFYDAYLRLSPRAPPDDVVIVAIDEHSLMELGRWPWPRSVHAELLDRLSDARPRLIGFDVIFAEADAEHATGDAQLARSIRANSKVVLPVAQVAVHQGGPLLEILPMPPLPDVARGLGHVEVELDRDGVARSVFLQAGLGSPYWPHLALRLLQLSEPGEDKALPGQRNPDAADTSHLVWVRDHRVWIPFAGPPGHYRSFSYVDVLRGVVPPEALRDRYVLVGATAAGLGDFLPTPVSGEGQAMPGVEIVANVFDALRQGLSIEPLGAPGRLLLSLILVGIPALLYPLTNPRWSLAIGAGSLLLVLLSSWLLLRLGHLWFGPSVPLIGCLLAYILWSWSRLARTVGYLNQELMRLHAEPAGLQESEAFSLPTTMEFIRHVLPVSGCTLCDQSGVMRRSWGNAPHPPPETPPATGVWMGQAGNLWRLISRGSGDLWLGIGWDGAIPPSPSQAELLQTLATRLTQPKAAQPRTPLEIVQARIQQVQEATTRLRSLSRFISKSFAQLPDGVLVTDALGQVLMANRFTSLYLLEDAERQLAGAMLDTLLEGLAVIGNGAWSDAVASVLLRHESVQLAVRTPAGRDLLLDMAPFFDGYGKGIQGLIVTIVDITPIKSSERRRAEMLNFLSHDLRSPLVSIISITQLAALQPEKLQDGSLLQRIDNHVHRALDLADDFLRLARVDSEQKIVCENLNLRSVAELALEQVAAQAEAKKIHLRHRFGCEAPWLEGDPELLERALVNLLTNAIKYSPEGAAVTLGLTCAGDRLDCEVTDTGYGIPEEHLKSIFDRFQRLGDSRHRKAKGAGLGLVLVKTVAERHHGSIEVTSRSGEGSSFRLRLPRRQPATESGAEP